jgi:DeoR/GlpR family transcriptional regulator of sugar metabolism
MKKIRTYDILAYLKKKKRCTLRELMEKFGVSSATIHRDVTELVS